MIPKPVPKGYPRDASFMFPERFTGIDACDALMMELCIAAYKNGFSLVVQKTCSKPSKYRSFYFNMSCDHGKCVFKKKTWVPICSPTKQRGAYHTNSK